MTFICATGDYLHFQLPEDCYNEMTSLYSPQREAEHIIFTYKFISLKQRAQVDAIVSSTIENRL